MDAVTPAHTAILAIYNPSLAPDDEHLEDQILFYYSAPAQTQSPNPKESDAAAEREASHERLRQIGLAQGLVQFGKSFAASDLVDAVDTEKSRVILHELEPEWWILVSIQLTRIEQTPSAGKTKAAKAAPPRIEYTSREVAPHVLLLQQIRRSFSVFLMHHGPSLSSLYQQLSRPHLSRLLERYWSRFIRHWDVLLSGNPAVDVFNGIKLAAGGELGIGVGEEEWGSGEREVLEGFISRTEGLVDLVAARFGEPSSSKESETASPPWLGADHPAEVSDGIIFTGVGHIHRSSLCSVAPWLESIYRLGQAAYGLRRSNRGISRQAKEAKSQSTDPAADDSIPSKQGKVQSGISANASSPDIVRGSIPAPIVVAAETSLQRAEEQAQRSQESAAIMDSSNQEVSGTDTLMRYMTFGYYGSSRDTSVSRGPAETGSHKSDKEIVTESSTTKSMPQHQYLSAAPSSDQRTSGGCFLIGLRGDPDNEDDTEDDEADEDETSPRSSSRISSRTVYIRDSDKDESVRPLRLLLYVVSDLDANSRDLKLICNQRRPFVFAFFFRPDTASLNRTAFYRSLHHQLGPLQRPLLRSTAPSNVAARLYEAVSPQTITPVDRRQPIYDLIFDPQLRTIHATIPNIPEPSMGFGAEARLVMASVSNTSSSTSWTRLDALNVHSQILATVAAAHRPANVDVERTTKTNRGWWVVWMRLPLDQNPVNSTERNQSIKSAIDSDKDKCAAGDPHLDNIEEASGARRSTNPEKAKEDDKGTDKNTPKPLQPAGHREALLVRRATDHVATTGGRKTSLGFGLGFGGSSSLSQARGAGRLVEGMGIDTRRYVEGLMSLNR